MSDPIVIAILVPPIQNIDSPHDKPMLENSMEWTMNNRKILTVFGFDIFTKNNSVWINGKYIRKGIYTTYIGKIDAIYDRFPSQARSQHFTDIVQLSCSIPFANPPSLTTLCRDKLACQRFLEENDIPMPPVCETTSTTSNAVQILKDWNTAFLKPRFGSLGVGVEQISYTSNIKIPPTVTGLQGSEPSILQKAITPPIGWAGWSVRQLCQRQYDAQNSISWKLYPSVVRASIDDSVVNVARGAQTHIGEEFLPSKTIAGIKQQSMDVCRAFSRLPDGKLAVELGLDFVIDADMIPWLIEVNSRPRGRLRELAKKIPSTYQPMHEQACTFPVLYLASIVQNTVQHEIGYQPNRL